MKQITKKLKLAGISLVSVMTFLCFSNAAYKIANPDFSGQWTLNEGKSNLGQYGGRMSARKMKVTMDANGISADKTVNGQNGETTTTDKLTFDGKETSSAFFGTSTKKSTAKWSDDGQALNVTWVAALDRNGEKTEIKGSDSWKLADANTLTIESTSTSSFGTMTTKLVYDKAK